MFGELFSLHGQRKGGHTKRNWEKLGIEIVDDGNIDDYYDDNVGDEDKYEILEGYKKNEGRE